MRRLMALLLWMALAPVVPASADPPDLHDYWDGRCKSCHGDAGDFARSTLQVEQGRLIGRHMSTGIGRPRMWERARYYGEEKRLAAALDAMEVADEAKTA